MTCRRVLRGPISRVLGEATRPGHSGLTDGAENDARYGNSLDETLAVYSGVKAEKLDLNW